MVAVGEAVVDRGEAGGTLVGEPADLDGSRLAGEHEQAVLSHVHGEVDEDVDVVLAYEPGDLHVVQPHRLAPDVAQERIVAVMLSGRLRSA